jgi:hypothetical protein
MVTIWNASLFASNFMLAAIDALVFVRLFSVRDHGCPSNFPIRRAQVNREADTDASAPERLSGKYTLIESIIVGLPLYLEGCISTMDRGVPSATLDSDLAQEKHSVDTDAS